MNKDTNWTSFNSGKIFSHIARWKLIEKCCPPPVLITVDPSNICNLSCEWCNAKVMCSNKKMLSRETMNRFIDFVQDWNVNGYRVEAICIAGGGEPLCNPYVGEFMRKLNDCNIAVATVTNGTLIDEYIEDLLVNEYVAVSVDAGNSKTFNKYKGLSSDSRMFDKVICNMEKLCKRANEQKCNLGKPTNSHGVNYRMLLYNDNIKEISEAARIAQEIGCNSLHIRPASTPYNQDENIFFTDEQIDEFYEQVRIVKEQKSSNFGFYYTLDKFNDRFQKENDFHTCHAIFMTATLMPPQNENPNGFCFNVCCDRRSDKQFQILTNETDVGKIADVWGNKLHWDLFKKIDKYQIECVCPRCTYYEHNNIYEKCVENDDMLVNFI